MDVPLDDGNVHRRTALATQLATDSSLVVFSDTKAPLTFPVGSTVNWIVTRPSKCGLLVKPAL